MKHKTLLVARREYFENLRTKTFWIGILVVPIILTLAIAVPVWLEMAKEARSYAVIDRSGWLLAAVEHRSAEDDLANVLETALERERLGRIATSGLPAEVREAAAALSAALPAAPVEAIAAPSRGREERRDRDERVLQALARSALGAEASAGESLADLLSPADAERLAALAPPLAAWWQGVSPAEARKISPNLGKSRFQRVEVAGGGAEAAEELNRRVGAGEIFGYFVLAEEPIAGQAPGRFVSRNLTDRELYEWFTGLANEVVRERRLAERQIDPAVARWVQEPVPFEARRVGAGGEEAEVRTQDFVRQWAPVAFVYLLWIAVMSIVQMLLNNTIEEKSNRILEVLLSSVSPLQLMVGKVVGIAATGLTMIGTWVLFLVGAVSVVMALVGDRVDLGLASVATDPLLLGSFIVYFALGYLLYAAFIVGVGSVCNTLKEAQNLMMPIMMMMMVPLFAMMPIGKDPNSTFARVLSYIPPFTPFVMMNRAAGPPTLFEYLVTTVILVLSVAGAFWAAAKIFRIGILMTGKPPRLGEMLRWLRAPVGQVPDRRNVPEIAQE